MANEANRIGRVLGGLLLIAAAAPAAGEQRGPSAAAKDSSYVPAGYVQVFADEMNGPSLDTSKWWTRYIYENGMLATLNDERQLYAENDNHVMTGTALRLTARVKPDPQRPRFLYESGMIRSKPTFKYGYFEARVKVPDGIGMWPCFWLNSDADAAGKAEWPPEIDFFEFVNNGKEDRADMLHTGVVVKKHKNQGPNPWGGKVLEKHEAVKPRGALGGAIYHAPFRFPDDFHVVGGLWDTDDTVTILVDGVRLVKFDYKWVRQDGSVAPYAHVLLNLGVGGGWAGRHGIDDDANFPKAFEIDYVRVYQKPDHQMVGQSTIGHDLLKPAVPASAKGGPTPYPSPDNESAWEGTGPIRVFQWMTENRAYFWTQRQKDQGAIVFVGDSLIGNWKDLKTAFPGKKVANRGIGGDVSRGVLFRLKEDVLDLKPKAIVLLVGTNDLSAHAPPEGIEANIASILEKVKAQDTGLKVVLCTIPPRNAEKAPIKDGVLADLNARLAGFASGKDNVILVDVYAAMVQADDLPNPGYFKEDLLHFSAKGYEKLGELVGEALAKVDAGAGATTTRAAK